MNNETQKYTQTEPTELPELPHIEGVTRLSEVEAGETWWLWEPYIPRGKITLLTADPGTGKTFLALYLAANVSAGRRFYGESEDAPHFSENVVYQTAEDGFADTIKPRLTPMRPDFRKILNIDETSAPLTLDDPRIEELMSKVRPALMVFDPLQAYLGAEVDMHRANAVRPILAHISRLAEMYQTAVVFIMHNSKMQGAKALYRALGSIDFTAVARSMLVIGNSPERDGSLVLCHEKSSLAATGRSLRFRLDPEGRGVTFLGECDYTAEQVMDAPKVRKRGSPKLEEAAAALSALLRDRGFAEFSEVEKMCEKQNFGLTTMFKARSMLKVRSVKIGKPPQTNYWALPAVTDDDVRNYHFSQPYPLEFQSP